MSAKYNDWARVTIEDLETGCHKALETAEDLLNDARLLLENRRFPRTYALAQLAQEELTKIPMLFRVGSEIQAGRIIDWKQLRKRFRSHRHKTWGGAIADFARGSPPGANADDSTLLEAEVAATDVYLVLKEWAFYSDYTEEGFISPRDIFTQADAVASLLERVEARAVFFRKSLPLVLSSYRHEFTDQQKKWLDLATADMSYDDRIRLLSILKRALQTHLAEDAEKSTPG